MGKKLWVPNKKSWVPRKKSWVPRKKSWVLRKSWVPEKVVGSKQNISIYLPFSLWNACFFSSEAFLNYAQIYIVLERVKAGFLISADRFINIITKCQLHAPYSSNIWTL